MPRRIAVLLAVAPVLLLAQGQKMLTVKQLFGSTEFSGRSIGAIRWYDGGGKLVVSQMDSTTKAMNLWTRSLIDDKRQLLVDVGTLKLDPADPVFQYTSWQFSPGDKQILFVSAPPEKQYLSRLTPAGNFFLYDLEKKTFHRLTNAADPQYNQKFSPDGRTLAFVRTNNIYVLDIASGVETRLTDDGSETVINGKFDWVYEEEFGIADGFSFSPDGRAIAYWRLDQTRVPEFRLMDFNSLRADVTTMRYPKAGDPNSIVRIGVVSLDTRKTTWMDLGPEDDIYVPRMQWSTLPNTVAITRLNRLQNRVELLWGDAATGRTSVFFTEQDSTYIEEGYDLRFLKGKDHFFWISERDGYSHLYLFDFNGKLVRQVTGGSWDIGSLLNVDEKEKTVYYAASANSPVEQQIYSVRFDGSGRRQLTKDGYSHTANFAPDGSVFIDTYSSLSMPAKAALLKSNGSVVRILEENPMEHLKEYKLGRNEFFSFTTSDGVSLNGWMVKPADFDPSKSYPVLVYVYGGPGSQTVVNRWTGSNHLWHHLLTQKGYIVVSVDGRGTGARGKAFKSITYKKLGQWEVNDQVEAAKWLRTQSYVDGSRIGIWGWSYGGYMASLTILKGADYFKTAVAIAPVTDWKFYDNVYTERFMQRPSDNPEGYKAGSPMTYAGKLKGHLLVVHGTTDDNVHWQNSVQFADALQKAGKQFQTMFYVNRNHGIGGGTTRVHLFDMITNFLLEKL